ncbi:MAG: hypothetical protein AB8F78_06455 [Saprospiraceae bacterium]
MFPVENTDEYGLNLSEAIATEDCEGNYEVDVFFVSVPSLSWSAPVYMSRTIIQQMNVSLNNSEVNNLSYRFAGHFALTSYPFINATTSSISGLVTSVPSSAMNDLNALLNDPTSELAIEFANSNADQLAILCDNCLSNAEGTSQFRSAPGSRRTTILETEAIWNLVGPHEFAHNHGCGHESIPANPSPPPPPIMEFNSYARGAVIDGAPDDGVYKLSVMTIKAPWAPDHNANTWGTPIPYFSNPDVFWNGLPTGAQSRDNARQLGGESRCTVASMATNPSSLIISGTTQTDPKGTITLSATGVCSDGSSPNHIDWYIVRANENPRLLLVQNGGSNFTYTLDNIGTTTIDILCHMSCYTDGDAVDFYSETHTIIIDDREGCPLPHDDYEQFVRFPSEGSSVVSQLDGLVVIDGILPTTKAVFLTDILGRANEIKKTNWFLQEGKLHVNIDGALPRGQVSFITVLTNEGIQTYKVYE